MTQPPQRWLFGPFPDLFFGCGLIYILAFGALIFAGPQMRELIPMELTPLVLLVSGVPHYGATLLRVYQRREDRRRYALFGTWATLLVAAAFVAGVYEFAIGSALVTIYLTWSPWHYSAQNYGIAIMFLRRRQVQVSGAARQMLKWSFTLSFVLTFLALHGQGPEVAYAPLEYERSAYALIRPWIPYDVVQVAVPVVLGAYLTCLVGTWITMRRASLRDLLPTVLLIGSQALWFTVPMLARHADVMQSVDPLSTEHATYVFIWIAVAHSVQYVWITSYFAQRSPTPPTQTGYLTRTLLAGAGIWTIPALIFAPGVLGTVPFDAGLGALLAACVNIHHFILDGAIWKLRDGKIAKILLRGQSDDATDRSSPVATWALRAVGVLSVGVMILSPIQVFRSNRVGNDIAAFESAQESLRWIGQDSALTRVDMALVYQRLGREEAARGNVEESQRLRSEAVRHAEAAQDMFMDWGSLANLGVFFQHEGRMEEAFDFIARAHELKPESPKLNYMMAQMLLLLRAHEPQSLLRAVSLAEAAVEGTDSVEPSYLRTLTMAYANVGRFQDALRTIETGLAQTEPGTEIHGWFVQQQRIGQDAIRARNQ